MDTNDIKNTVEVVASGIAQEVTKVEETVAPKVEEVVKAEAPKVEEVLKETVVEVEKEVDKALPTTSKSKVVAVLLSIGRDILTLIKALVSWFVKAVPTILEILKNMLLHPVASAIIILVIIFAARYKIQTAEMQKQALEAEISALKLEETQWKAELAQLHAQIVALDDQHKKNIADNAKFTKGLVNKSSDELKQLILTLSTRIKQERK
jgi:cell division protein FtsB